MKTTVTTEPITDTELLKLIITGSFLSVKAVIGQYHYAFMNSPFLEMFFFFVFLCLFYVHISL